MCPSSSRHASPGLHNPLHIYSVMKEIREHSRSLTQTLRPSRSPCYSECTWARWVRGWGLCRTCQKPQRRWEGVAVNISGILPGEAIKPMCEICIASLFTEWILINKWSLEGKWIDTWGHIWKNYKHIAFSLAIHHTKHTGKSFCFFFYKVAIMRLVSNLCKWGSRWGEIHSSFQTCRDNHCVIHYSWRTAPLPTCSQHSKENGFI